MPAQNLELDRETLHKRYQQLPSDEKIVLQLLSIIYEPAHINDLQACIDDLPKSISRTVSTAGLASQLKHLHKKLKLLQKCKHGHWRCDPLVVELVTRDLAKTKRLDRFVKAVGRAMPLNQHWRGGPMPRSFDQVMREVRIGLYTHDFDYVTLVFENSPLMSLGVEDDFSDLLFEIINNPFDIAWFKTLPVWFQINIVESQTDESTLDFANIDEVVTLLRELVEEYPSNDNLIRLLLSQLLFRGQFSEAQVLCETHSDTHHKSYYFGCIAAVTGQAEAACRHFKTSLKLKAKEQHRRSQDLEGIGGILLLTAGLRAKQLPWVRRQLTAMLRAEHVFADICELFEVVLDYHGGDLSKRHHVYQYEVLSLDAGYAIDSLFMAMGWYWILPEQAKQFIPILEEILDAAIAARYEWFAVETAHLLQRIDSAGDYLSQVQSFATAEQVAPIVDLIKPVAPWELCLSALTTLNQPADLTQSFNHGQRLVWLLSMTGQSWSLTPKEQKVTAKGAWSKGRAVSLKRLSESVEDLDYLTEQDRRICRCIETERVAQYDYYYYGSVNYVLEAQAIAELVGHPLVFWENAPDVKVELVAGEPEILVRQVDSDNLTLELSPQIYDDASHIVEKETLTRVKVIAVKPEHQRIATILGEQNSLQVPLEAKERVLEAINSISQLVTVQSDIGVGNEAIAEVPSSATPYLQLFPLNEGLNIKLLMRPFDQMGPYFAPGKGGKTVIAEIEGTRTLTNRDLEAESTRAQQVVDSCAVLQEIPPENHEWILDNPEDCLEVLLAAQSLEGQVVIEWPEGQSFKLKPQVDLANLNLSLMRQRDWFVVNGEVELDAEQVINLQQLMALLKDAKGRFLPLGKGQFLALTDTFRKRLEELQAVSEKHGKGMRLNPLASLAIEDWMDEVGNLKTDKHWKQHVKRLKDVRTLEPSLPSTLQAELRDYQIDGFKWLARLSAWGVGACLADDMGLGKTLQAIALILTRAPQGPALIVAPTSVGMNWISEAQRFAPTLNPIQFGSGDRQTMVDSLRSFDMLICTYGLLQRTEIAQMLSAVAWQVIVLDEAQAIKNSATKRSKAAMKLQSEFKILTTGTPIENHLGELWNLFRFITPGLLGSLDQFNQRFANPIERDNNPIARSQLKKLIQPFILRRTKTEVLDELPSRTEIPLYVELSQKEQVLYEALRQDAIQSLSSQNKKEEAGTKHLRVLAEITRLRRCCCNPELVAPPEALPGICSKLNLFGEVLEELLSNHHKALVFSQFVDHLKILRRYLDEQDITYQYLDGSTPAKQRKTRVDAFQAGKGDVFLISLKAGGTGLNLTAADYVIHMDPWWNPAVEDQASDRAHRIGQKRPVTIYRLITRNTIEEKIVDLHRQKRDLADSLLEGSDMSGKISTDELLRLIHT